MKRFDFAAEVAKQLITISSAIITVIIAFYEKFFSKEPIVFFLVFGDLLLFIISIVIGVLSIGGIVTLVGRQELADTKSAPNEKTKLKPPRAKFVSLFGSTAMTLALWQQFFFAIGLFTFIAVAVTDKIGWLGSAQKFPSASVAPIFPSPGTWPPF